ncbi:hypothetical protein [Caproiciproducens galactitolivorans]|uniref:Uncharacterized protein n=1 Tax=Caproiciproducens galactitolivorans TaxID=642589 RepID=A0ABT4BUG0_9FIRM|nr:hypothetical protein [Caproiciproducens galactitolivorans]MCY1714509.1 hypothetical protein [Caproiciproducens galactitolivorans]
MESLGLELNRCSILLNYRHRAKIMAPVKRRAPLFLFASAASGAAPVIIIAIAVTATATATATATVAVAVAVAVTITVGSAFNLAIFCSIIILAAFGPATIVAVAVISIHLICPFVGDIT